MASFKQMIADKVMKRPDGRLLIQLDNIHVIEGHDLREDNERNREADEKLFQFMMKGGKVPPLEVKERDEGGVWVIEGHRRRRGYLRCRETGKPVDWIEVTQFKGNDVDGIARIFTSNNQHKLSDYEKAIGIKKLDALNLTPDEIAEVIHESRYVVDRLLEIAYADHKVQQLVKEEAVSVGLALDRMKENKAGAAETLTADAEKAKRAGRKKATQGTATPQFSAKRARQLAELLYDAEFTTLDGRDSLLLRDGTKGDITNILNEYRQFQN